MIIKHAWIKIKEEHLSLYKKIKHQKGLIEKEASVLMICHEKTTQYSNDLDNTVTRDHFLFRTKH